MCLLFQFLFTARFFLLAFRCWLLVWPSAGRAMPPTLSPTGVPHECGCEDRDLVMIPAVPLVLTQQPGESNVMTALTVTHTAGEVPSCGYLPLVASKSTNITSLGSTRCRLAVACFVLRAHCKRTFGRKTTEKWTVSASRHPPMVGSEFTALWACLNEKWFLSWHLGMWKANKCSQCFSVS